MTRVSKKTALLLLVSGAFACEKSDNTQLRVSDKADQVAVPISATTTPIASGLATGAPDFATLAAKVVPTVVSIQVQQKVRVGGPGRGFAGPDPFDFFRFFGQEVPREYENRGLGSGFIIDGSGLILTNQHVVEKADSIEVTFALPDGGEKRLAAKIVGQAPDYDVALIKTEEDAKATATLELGDSESIRIGDWVMAIGNPFGLDHSVSVGIISAKQRRGIAPSGREGLYDFLQTDASINPGNSGGPLVNLRGEVIGINAAVNAQGQGIGFAIPVNMVKAMLPQLRAGGRYGRSWLGLHIQPVTPELAQSYGLDETRGVLVADVVARGPAERAGLKEGDVVLMFDGKKLKRASDLQLFAGMAGVGKTVELVIWRSNKELKVTVKLEAFRDEAAPAEEARGEEAGKTDIGLSVDNVPANLRQRLELSQGGVIVDGVESGSPAARAGLARGDVILAVNDRALSDAAAFIKAIKAAKSGEVLRLRVMRQGMRTFMAVRKP